MRFNNKKFLRDDDSHDDGEGNWLISYADLMTLLWGFFVILTAFSSPDPAKMEQLKKSTAESMGGTYTNSYNTLTDKLKTILLKDQIAQDATVEKMLDGIKITFNSKYFFNSASSKLKDKALVLLKNIGIILSKEALEYNILIEGHTDDLPIHTRKYPSNWELSLLRAVEVVHLFEKVGIPHNNIRPMGLSDTKPLVKIKGLKGNMLQEARNKNRRIIVYVKKKLVKRL